MHILTVIDHHKPTSFTHAVAAAFREGAEAAGHTVETADLHAEGFDPVWTAGDDAQFADQPMPTDVLAYQARIERAQGLCMVFPLWWWGMPSMMKGWVDRVFSWNWAYNHTQDPDPTRSPLYPKTCVFLVPAGSSPQEMERQGYAQALERIWPVGTMSYMGISEHRLHFLHGVEGKAERRVKHLETAWQAGNTMPEPRSAAAPGTAPSAP